MNSGAALAEAPKSVQAHFLKLVISCRVLTRKEGHNCKSTLFFLLPVPPFNSPLSHTLLACGCRCGFTLQNFVVMQMCKPCGFLQAYLCLLDLFPFSFCVPPFQRLFKIKGRPVHLKKEQMLSLFASHHI